MTWNNAELAYFFGDECTQGNSKFVTPDESNAAFRERYCSQQTLSLMARDGVSDDVVRCVINRIAELTPDADHSTPKWSDGPLPLIVVARARISIRARVTLVCRSPRFGLCLHDRRIYLWANVKDIQSFNGFGQGRDGMDDWIPWRGGDLLRYSEPLDCNCGIKLIAPHPLATGHPLAKFLSYMGGEIGSVKDSPSIKCLRGALEPCRLYLDEPEDFEVIYPKLAAQAGDADDENDEAHTPATPTSGPKPTRHKRPHAFNAENQSEPMPVASTNAESMFQVLRQVAIFRVRNSIPDFSEVDLDEWIMSTGYAGSRAPHSDLADLFFVYAASLANAGGRKPQHDNFGAIIREGMRPFLENDRIERIPTLQELAQNCQPYLGQYPLGGTFDEDVNRLAAALPSRALMTGLMGSVPQFAKWLLDNHDGKAATLHTSLKQSPEGHPGLHVFPLLRGLAQLPWMGAATAANFLKDSQVTGLITYNPRTVANTIAGWFPKPDLHVARLMAYITGRYQNHDPQRLKLAQALALFREMPSSNFQGNYERLSNQYAFDMKVIADIHEWAQHIGTSPLEIDRVLYLIGVRKTIINGHPVECPSYHTFVQEVDAAISRGFPRKS